MTLGAIGKATYAPSGFVVGLGVTDQTIAVNESADIHSSSSTATRWFCDFGSLPNINQDSNLVQGNAGEMFHSLTFLVWRNYSKEATGTTKLSTIALRLHDRINSVR